MDKFPSKQQSQSRDIGSAANNLFEIHISWSSCGSESRPVKKWANKYLYINMCARQIGHYLFFLFFLIFFRTMVAMIKSNLC